MPILIKNCLPNETNWPEQLVVVNCGKFYQLQRENQVYACPAKNASYSHRRCLYLGMYLDLAVKCVARVSGVVDVDPLGNAAPKVLWNNEDPSQYTDEQLITDACERLTACFSPAHAKYSYPHRVFVLKEISDTHFRTGDRFKIKYSKRYFWVGDEQVRATSAEELAQNLRGLKWTYWN